MTRSRPTLEDVAAHAGVSRATVSRVINGSPKVSDEVRDTVEASIRTLGYVPNRAARALVTQRTDTVALVVSEPDTMLFNDPFFGGIVRGVSLELQGSGEQLVLMMVATDADHERFERYVRGGHIDGVLLLSLHGADPLPNALARAGIPTVLGGRILDNQAGLPCVDVDNVGGAQQAVRRLVQLGRQRIATIAGPQNMGAGVDRLVGYQQGLAPHRFRSDLVEVGDFTQESGARAMAALLDRVPDLDAVFAASDLMAVGALATLRSAGRQVPDDVALIGFDDHDVARYVDPPLTTVRQPIVEMGRAMTRRLLSLLDPAAATTNGADVLPTELIVRESA
ncbi:MAG: LacI family transcriptional regulator [Sporichthyaceae bacterium]|nr:LacI family transcriptional regulator [Sporichthyaceae bacterium]